MNKRDVRRRNAKLFPIYKMFSWDLLFFYSIEFLFYTITKKVTASEVLIAGGVYLIFKVIMQIPTTLIMDSIGKRRTMIFGNFVLVFYMLCLIYIPGLKGIIIANILCAFGYDLKNFSETNLLYDSVATKGGDGLFSRIDSRGATWWYVLDGVASLISGYLFVMNNYLPMYICLSFLVISTILSFGFVDVTESKPAKKKKNYKKVLREYKETFKFVFNSSRMKALIMFQVVFYSLIKIIGKYESNLLLEVGIPEEQFAMIMAGLSLIGAISSFLKDSVEKKFKNKTLAFISLSYIMACIFVGFMSCLYDGPALIPIILVMFAIISMSTSIWWILEAKYLKNFTEEKTRGKITFAYEFIGCMGASICSVLAGLLIDKISIQSAFLIVGLIALMAMVLTLDYMRKRIGLKPKKYEKNDIELKL